jgi:hypothetical protein
MKTHSIRQQAGERRSASVAGVLAICGALLLGATHCPSAGAQSGPSAQTSAAATTSDGQSVGRQIAHGNQAFRVVTAADVQTAADNQGSRSRPQPVEQVSWTSPCSSCGTGCGGTCGGGYSDCGSCGGNCRGNCGGGYSPFSGVLDPCGPCQPFFYASFDAMYMKRDGTDSFTVTEGVRFNGLDSELGGRFTIGRIPNCVDGYEASFTGVFQWDAAAALDSPGGGIPSRLVPGGSLLAADLSAFTDNVVSSSQFFEAEYWSVEANKLAMGWDYAKLLYGIRFAEVDEEYLHRTRNNAGEVGLLTSGIKSRLVGIQGGLDLLYPVGRHTFTDFRSRIGGFINFAEADVAVINDGTFVVARHEEDQALAGIIEIGAGVRYQLGQMLAIRGGVELWYLTGNGSALDQFRNVVTATSGVGVDQRDNFLVTGVSVGAELRY